jgi:hypothetical protein
MFTRLKKLAVITLATTLALMALDVGIASAGPGTCGSSDTGCLAWYGDINDQYRFQSSDSDLSNNHFVTESCGYFPYPSCIPELVVQDHLGDMRLNSASYPLMCVYANYSYVTPIYWIFSHGAWYSTGRAGKSMRYRTGSSC